MAKYKISDRIRTWGAFPGEFIIGQIVLPIASFGPKDEDVLVEVRLGIGPLGQAGTRLLRMPLSYLDLVGLETEDIKDEPVPEPPDDNLDYGSPLEHIKATDDLRKHIKDRLAARDAEKGSKHQS